MIANRRFKLFFLFTFFAAFTVAQSLQAGAIERQPVERISQLIQSLWPEKKCSDNISVHVEYTVVSIACVGDYTANTRKRILDIFFKSGLSLVKEIYQIEKKSGMYLYKVEDKTDPYNYRFFKIYVRNARILWPVHERQQPQIAIFVQNLQNLESLLKWQTLGIPISYGVMPQKQNSTEVFQKINEYGQELWITLALESDEGIRNDYRTITVEDAKSPEKLNEYFDLNFPKELKVTGVASYQGSLFMKDIFSLRNLFSQLRKRGIHYFLDTHTGNSGGYDTARVMSMTAFRSDEYIEGSSNEMQAAWNRATSKAKESGGVVIIVEGNNEAGWKFLKDATVKYAKTYEFTFVSDLPVN